jgi:hypothetical protein
MLVRFTKGLGAGQVFNYGNIGFEALPPPIRARLAGGTAEIIDRNPETTALAPEGRKAAAHPEAQREWKRPKARR